MEWLNRIDDVLESALGSRKRSRPDQKESEEHAEKANINQPSDVTEKPACNIPSEGKSWEDDFIQANHRVIASANEATEVQVVQSGSSVSSQISNHSSSARRSALTRAPGRLRRKPMRPQVENEKKQIVETKPDGNQLAQFVSLCMEDIRDRNVAGVVEKKASQIVKKSPLVDEQHLPQSEAAEPLRNGDFHGKGKVDTGRLSPKYPKAAKSMEKFGLPPADMVPHETALLKSKAATVGVGSNNDEINDIVCSSYKKKETNEMHGQEVSENTEVSFRYVTDEAKKPKCVHGSSEETHAACSLTGEENGAELIDFVETIALDTIPRHKQPTSSPGIATQHLSHPNIHRTSKIPSSTEDSELSSNRIDDFVGDDDGASGLKRPSTLSATMDNASRRSEQATIFNSVPTKHSLSSFQMSPVVEESSHPASFVESTETLLLPGEDRMQRRPKEARSVGPTPGVTKLSKPEFRRALSDTEATSVVSDSQIIPRQVAFQSDFDVEHAIGGWEEPPTDVPPYVPSMNCFGAVHVRVLRAQRLPCPVGSMVQAIVSLPPWKGRIRTKKSQAFAGSRRQGVCTEWSDADAAISMVHAYSSTESPVPSISIAVVFSTMGVFEFNMCSLSLSCEFLLRQPMIPQRQWFQTLSDGKERSVENIPLLQLEALFEPEKKLMAPMLRAPIDVVEVRRKESTDDSLLESASSVLPSVAGSTRNTRQPPSRQQSLSDRSNRRSLLERKGSASVQNEQDSIVARLPRRYSDQQGAVAVDDRSEVSFSLQSYRKMHSNLSTKGHLLRTKLFYTPTWCSVCGGSIMSGIWKVQSFRCEECGVDCCSDCRLQVDIQLPCGSDEARKAADEAAEAQFTSEKLLKWVAPIEETITQLARQPLDDTKHSTQDRSQDNEPGIGKIKFTLIQAMVLKNPVPAACSVDMKQTVAEVKRGDYYVRVVRSDSTKTARTRTVQGSTRLQFDSTEICVSVPHYGSEFRLELVDATDDHTIGFVYMTAQMVLQEQRDEAVRCLSLGAPQSCNKMRRVVRALRRFEKVGSSNEYFASDSSKGSGEIMGVIEFHVALVENFKALYGPSPYECPGRPKDALDLAKFQAHIRRISQIIAGVRSMTHTFGYVVSWENPVLTAVSLILFATFCYNVHPDHFFTGPVFVWFLYMVYLAFLRTTDGLKNNFLEKELSLNRKSNATPEYLALHRPVGLLKAGVLGGRNIRSPEMGLPGNVSCRISIDLARLCSDSQRKSLIAIDGAAETTHIIGCTETVYSTSPQWHMLEESESSKRLRNVVPGQENSWSQSSRRHSLPEVDFPVLQPIGRDKKTGELELRSWTESNAAVVFEVVSHDFVSILPVSEHILGEVVVPLTEIIEKGEVAGWRVLAPSATSELFAFSRNYNDEEKPAINFRIKWAPPTQVEHLPADVEREASIVMQEELFRTVQVMRKKNAGLVGTSLGAINTVRGISGYLLAIQNGLGSFLDTIEAFRNLFNFSDPLKSSAVMVVLIVLWYILFTIPFRAIVFAVGAVPYITSLKLRCDRQRAKSRRKSKYVPKAAQGPQRSFPVETWLKNFFRGLPLDSDLRDTYYWEIRRSVAKQLNEETEERRHSRLRKLWRSRWYETVQILSSVDGANGPTFRVAFAVVQGRRFMWWSSAEDFDRGEEPAGKIFLQGHAGLATPTPIELKAIADQSSNVVCIFGRGLDKQERVTFLVSGRKSKDGLEEAVNEALLTKQD